MATVLLAQAKSLPSPNIFSISTRVHARVSPLPPLYYSTKESERGGLALQGGEERHVFDFIG